jgi:hypothetical protein
MWTEISTDLMAVGSPRFELGSGRDGAVLRFHQSHNAVWAGRLREGRSARDQLPRKRRPAMTEETTAVHVLS